MTLAEMKKLNKAEISWYSFIAGLAQYQNNTVEEVEVITIPDRYILVLVHIVNEKNHRHIEWKYRFNLDESVLVDKFINYISSELSYVEIVRAERRA